MPEKKSRNIYQLKITLKGAKPPIWRRILVPDNISLKELHTVIQITMGWDGSHLHQFMLGGTYYGIQDDDFMPDMDVENEAKFKLNQLVKAEKASIAYEYDFGDSWEHEILLEKIHPYDKKQKLPLCIKGKRACPPEDSGGVWGYQEMLEVLKDSEHPEHEEICEWIDEEFDPEEFDIDFVNEMLSKQCRIR